MRDLNQVKVLGVKGDSFVIRPSECGVVRAHDPLSEIDLFRIQKVLPESHLITSFASKSAGWNEDEKTRRKGTHSSEGIRMITTNDAGVLWGRCCSRLNLVRNLLV
jgi:hypothetical protein